MVFAMFLWCLVILDRPDALLFWSYKSSAIVDKVCARVPLDQFQPSAASWLVGIGFLKTSARQVFAYIGLYVVPVGLATFLLQAACKTGGKICPYVDDR